MSVDVLIVLFAVLRSLELRGKTMRTERSSFDLLFYGRFYKQTDE